MAEIGVRELKARASAIIRAVRDRRARYLVTYRGKPVGVLMPLGEAGREAIPPADEGEDAWKELLSLGEKIGQGWQSDLTAAELLSEIRR
ncbi:MAG: type II toxin-antitoxin system Phd/YefM family antitoxin [Chloroflexi bacterium]|nr:type II toxin-antitoxin system Phd/YefM family antitoxin [Chloroflexota bacterium]